MANELMEKYVYSQPGHRWLKDGMSKDQLQKIQDFYKERYGGQNEPRSSRVAIHSLGERQEAGEHHGDMRVCHLLSAAMPM